MKPFVLLSSARRSLVCGVRTLPCLFLVPALSLLSPSSSKAQDPAPLTISFDDYTLGSVFNGSSPGQGGWTQYLANPQDPMPDAEIVAGNVGRRLTIDPSTPNGVIYKELQTDIPVGFSDQGAVVFADFVVLPYAEANINESGFATASQAHIGFYLHNGLGEVAVYQGAGNGQNSGSWQPTGLQVPVDAVTSVSQRWLRVTIRQDFVHHHWDLYVNGAMVKAGIGLFNNSVPAVKRFTFAGNTDQPIQFDQFTVSYQNPLFPDSDRDGLPDSWESSHSMNPSSYDREAGSGLAQYLASQNGTSSSVPRLDTWMGSSLNHSRETEIFGANLSGITWSPSTQTYFGIQNADFKAIYEFSAEGSVLRVIRTSTYEGESFDDPEAICWMSGSEFVIAEERSRQLVFFNIGLERWHPRIPKLPARTLGLTPGLALSSNFPEDLLANNNNGLEGVAYNPHADCFYGVLEGEGGGGPDGPSMHLFRISRMDGRCDEILNAEAVLRPVLGDLSDVCYDAARNEILVLSDVSRMVAILSADGVLKATIPLNGGTFAPFGASTKPEGLACRPGEELVVVAEPNVFARYSRSTVNAAATGPVISEFMTRNDSGITDENGKLRDWIEIHNPTSASINLAGWSLTDDPEAIGKWVFPAVTIPSGGYLLVFASGKDRRSLNSPLHTNFKLNSSGGILWLNDPEGNSGSDGSYSYSTQYSDVSFGCVESALGSTGYFNQPTPGNRNQSPVPASGVTAVASAPTLGAISNFLSAPTALTITRTEPSGTVYYTTDGSEPYPENGGAVSFTSASATITISGTTILRAACVTSGKKPSESITKTFVFPQGVKFQVDPFPGRPTDGITFPNYYPSLYPPNIPFAVHPDLQSDDTWGGAFEESLSSQPSVFLVGDDQDLFHIVDGIYANSTKSGDPWERRFSFEWVDPRDPPDPPDPPVTPYTPYTPYHQAYAGLRMSGHSSRCQNVTLKHNFRLKFKSSYGASSLQLEGAFDRAGAVDEFQQIELRNPTSDSFSVTYWNLATSASYVRDAWFSHMMRSLGHPSIDRRFVHVYLNGKYWGVYEMLEHVDENYAASHAAEFGGQTSSKYDVVGAGDDSGGGAIAGNLARWQMVKARAAQIYSASTGQVDTEAYDDVLAAIDEDNLIDYMLLNIWGDNTDWPNHNYLMVCSKTPGAAGTTYGEFKFLSWDAEFAMQNSAAARSRNTWALHRYSIADGPAFLYRKLRYDAAFRVKIANRATALLSGNGPLTLNSIPLSVSEVSNRFVPFVSCEAGRWGDFAAIPSLYLRWQGSRDYLIADSVPSFASFTPVGGQQTTRSEVCLAHVLADLDDVVDTIAFDQARSLGWQGGYTGGSGGVPSGQNMRDEAATEDADHDGMPDAWETANGLNPNDSADASADSDGDSRSNREEFISGTNPGLVDSPQSGLSSTFNVFTPFVVGWQ